MRSRATSSNAKDPISGRDRAPVAGTAFGTPGLARPDSAATTAVLRKGSAIGTCPTQQIRTLAVGYDSNVQSVSEELNARSGEIVEGNRTAGYRHRERLAGADDLVTVAPGPVLVGRPQ